MILAAGVGVNFLHSNDDKQKAESEYMMELPQSWVLVVQRLNYDEALLNVEWIFFFFFQIIVSSQIGNTVGCGAWLKSLHMLIKVKLFYWFLFCLKLFQVALAAW